MVLDLSWVEEDETQECYLPVPWRLAGALMSEMERQGMLKDAEAPTHAYEGFNEIDTGPGGIPVYKLCSNDGWLVTPAEIEGALAVAIDVPGAPRWTGEMGVNPSIARERS